MTIRTTVTSVNFKRPFRFPNMDKDFPPGTYEVETDQEELESASRLTYRRIATRIRLQSPGLVQLLTIDQKDLDAALVDESRTD